jgi:flagellar biosynthetic protein FlhB
MADSEDEEAKTEAASERRLQSAWDDGQVPLGHDAHAVAGMVAGVIALAAVAQPLRNDLAYVLQLALGTAEDAPFRTLLSICARPFLLGLVVVAAAGLGSALATVTQTKGGFWGDLAAPDVTRLWNPRALKLFDGELWQDVGMAALKVAVLVAAAWPSIKALAQQLPQVATLEPGAVLSRMSANLATAGVRVLAAYALLAVADVLLQRYRYFKRMRMTKEEAKREYKDDEGDPMLKGRRKRRHREFIRGRAATEVPKADAVVVNPTHIAVALRYRRGEDKAPRVVAKGKGPAADRIRELARENGVPIVRDVPLARLLHKRVKVGGAVPAETYKAVAAVLAFVWKLQGKQPQAAASSRRT